VPAQPVLTRDEYFDGPTVRANRMRMSVEHPQLGEVEMMGVPLVIESAPGKVRGRAPLLGEHTAAVLAEARGAAPTAEPPSSETAGPHLLSGVRVLDLTAYIAGPVSGRHLAMLGAEVIKVEPPRGEPFRVSGLGFLGWNQGKRGITLDLSTDDGREVLYRLVRQADVLLENYRPGVTDRLKVDYETLRRINPRLVYVTQPGFGADEAMRDAPLFDPMVQSLSGAVDAQGGDDEPSRYSVSISDTMHPLISTFGVCAALRQRERTGEGQLVRTALAMTGLAYQAAEFTRFADAAHLRGGIDYAGPSAGERWYRCEDGVDIFVEARTADQRGALVAATGVAISPAAVSDGAGGPAAESLKAAFATRPREQWITVLDDAGVPCNAIVSRGDVLGHPAIAANELVVMQSHAQWAETTDVGMLVHASATPGRIERPAPTLSEHSQEVLTELGYDREEQSAMARAGVVVLEPPEQRG
jgi:crotonobetainyl-CoA:carnitine CoA-transferase CaiB-like acyl-CoA transferase